MTRLLPMLVLLGCVHLQTADVDCTLRWVGTCSVTPYVPPDFVGPVAPMVYATTGIDVSGVQVIAAVTTMIGAAISAIFVV